MSEIEVDWFYKYRSHIGKVKYVNNIIDGLIALAKNKLEKFDSKAAHIDDKIAFARKKLADNPKYDCKKLKNAVSPLSPLITQAAAPIQHLIDMDYDAHEKFFTALDSNTAKKWKLLHALAKSLVSDMQHAMRSIKHSYTKAHNREDFDDLSASVVTAKTHASKVVHEINEYNRRLKREGIKIYKK